MRPDLQERNLDILAPIFAGLGLFFVGIRLITTHLQQLAGPRVKRLLARALAGHRTPALFGFAVGAIMQSVNAVALMLAALVTARTITPKAAFPVLNWANLGSGVIVVVASLNLHLAVLLLIGVTGHAYYLNLDQSARYRHIVGLLLGVGLLFMGIDLTRTGSTELKEFDALQDLIAITANQPLVGVAIGVAVTVLAQSSTTVTIVAMTMAAAGVLDLDSGLPIVLGAAYGAGISAWLLANPLKGSARQLLLYQLVLKLSGATAMLVLLTIERITGLPMVIAALVGAGLDEEHCLAAFYVVMLVLSDVVMHLTHGRLERLTERAAPSSVEERLGQPHFIDEHSAAEPESGLLLIDREQQRLVAGLPAYLDRLREDGPQDGPSATVRRTADAHVARLCDEQLKDIVDRIQSRDVLERAIVLRDRNGLLVSLQETLAEIALMVERNRGAESTNVLIGSLIESLHAMLETLAASLATLDADDLEALRALTHDRSDLMDSIRRGLLSGDDEISLRTHELLFGVTALFERSVWLLRRYVLLLSPRAEAGTGGEA